MVQIFKSLYRSRGLKTLYYNITVILISHSRLSGLHRRFLLIGYQIIEAVIFLAIRLNAPKSVDSVILFTLRLNTLSPFLTMIK
jgi:hypothetical protein